MSGGKIQGDQPPQKKMPAEKSADQANRSIKSSRQQASRPSRGPQDTSVTNDSYGPPSADHERPMNPPGERDPLGIAPGRKNPST